MPRTATVLLIALLGCARGAELDGPPAPQADAVSEVLVTSLEETARQTVVSSAESVAAIANSWAFARHGWSASQGRELVPLYRIEFRGSGGARAVYWLGFNSHPPRFPCYSFCTGVWVSPSIPNGDQDLTRYKGLADTVRSQLFRDLKLPPGPLARS